ncbi:unnamed protein product [Cyprideis torosa]|uniref:G/T mismatch-specific thymine DNA glycosylase n=1 Tax=Cyprideis torosa TaxID=163714 RepID=A0A7R8W4G0_9CRUS|nr:unnamed protein product [Cyprideis torosa]CAG0879807.1 unnamed protein product [Cyprideis torosa]
MTASSTASVRRAVGRTTIVFPNSLDRLRFTVRKQAGQGHSQREHHTEGQDNVACPLPAPVVTEEEAQKRDKSKKPLKMKRKRHLWKKGRHPENCPNPASAPPSVESVPKSIETVRTRLAVPTTPQEASANWKSLMQVIGKAEKRKSDSPGQPTVPTKRQRFPASADQSAALDIWFDGVDELLLLPNKSVKAAADSASSTKAVVSSGSESSLVKEAAFKGLTRIIAMDCEMVGVGENGTESHLARVSIVNHFGHCVYDKYVRPRERVTDYRTFVSGVTREQLMKGEEFSTVQAEVSKILENRILVGHALKNDLQVLLLSHPRKMIRDTARFKPFRQLFGGRTPSLKNLTQRLLGVTVQDGQHDSVQDAQAAMRIFTMNRRRWEAEQRKGKPSSSASKKQESDMSSSMMFEQGRNNNMCMYEEQMISSFESVSQQQSEHQGYSSSQYSYSSNYGPPGGPVSGNSRMEEYMYSSGPPGSHYLPHMTSNIPGGYGPHGGELPPRSMGGDPYQFEPSMEPGGPGHLPPPQRKRGRKRRTPAVPPGATLTELDCSPEDLGEFGGRALPPVRERKKWDRFNGMPIEEVKLKTLPDHLVPNLDILMVGINPGLYAAYKGHHYAGPGNHFWKCLYLSGLIPEPLTAEDDGKLLEYGIGFTNMVQRPTKGSQDLSRREIKEGAMALRAKIHKFLPKIVVFNGKGIYEVFSGRKDFPFGKQPDPIEGCNTLVWVMPSSSARCAQLPRASDKVPFYMALRKLRDYLTGRISTLDESEVVFHDVRGMEERFKLEIKDEEEVGPLGSDEHPGYMERILPPPRTPSSGSSSALSMMEAPSQTQPTGPPWGQPIKKKRGRPRKPRPGDPVPPVELVPEAGASFENSMTLLKKRRGRPKKNANPQLEDGPPPAQGPPYFPPNGDFPANGAGYPQLSPYGMGTPPSNCRTDSVYSTPPPQPLTPYSSSGPPNLSQEFSSVPPGCMESLSQPPSNSMDRGTPSNPGSTAPSPGGEGNNSGPGFTPSSDDVGSSQTQPPSGECQPPFAPSTGDTRLRHPFDDQPSAPPRGMNYDNRGGGGTEMGTMGSQQQAAPPSGPPHQLQQSIPQPPSQPEVVSLSSSSAQSSPFHHGIRSPHQMPPSGPPSVFGPPSSSLSGGSFSSPGSSVSGSSLGGEEDVTAKSLHGLVSLVDQIPAIANGGGPHGCVPNEVPEGSVVCGHRGQLASPIGMRGPPQGMPPGPNSQDYLQGCYSVSHFGSPGAMYPGGNSPHASHPAYWNSAGSPYSPAGYSPGPYPSSQAPGYPSYPGPPCYSYQSSGYQAPGYYGSNGF